MKAVNLPVTKEFLDRRVGDGRYGRSMWVRFCDFMLDKGFTITLYEAQKTYSKYITLWKDGKAFKVRFSNHKPIMERELAGDCDFFVGVCHTKTTTTRDAAIAALNYFNEEIRKR